MRFASSQCSHGEAREGDATSALKAWRAARAAGSHARDGATREPRRRRSAQAPWPHLEALAAVTASAGKALVPRCAAARPRVGEPVLVAAVV